MLYSLQLIGTCAQRLDVSEIHLKRAVTDSPGQIIFSEGSGINGIPVGKGLLSPTMLFLDPSDPLKEYVKCVGILRYGFSRVGCGCRGVDKTGLIMIPDNQFNMIEVHEVCPTCCPQQPGTTQHQSAYNQYMAVYRRYKSHPGFMLRSFAKVAGYSYLRYSRAAS